MGLEDRHELASSIDLDALHGEGAVSMSLSRRALAAAAEARVATWPMVHLATGS